MEVATEVVTEATEATERGLLMLMRRPGVAMEVVMEVAMEVAMGEAVEDVAVAILQ